MKIGLFGGSFDPVHLAHEALAQQALKQFQLEHVFWIPASISPFKKSSDLMASPEHRLEMVRLVCESEPRFEVSSYEIEKGGISYSIETLRHFQSIFKSARFFWILGADTLSGITEWKESKTLMNELIFLVAQRGNEPLKILSGLKAEKIDLDWQPISSTEIKKGLSAGKYKDKIDPRVFEYIRQHQLYGAA